MKKFFALMIFGLMFAGCSANINKEPGVQITLGSSPVTTTQIASAISPAIVGISGDKDGGQSVGSGVCVSSAGHVLTNSHVVNGCKNITLFLSDKTTATAKLIYEDTVLDLAILESNKSLPYLPLGDSDGLEVGQDVLAVGTPLSLTLIHTFTKGIVSALNRTLKVNSSSGEGYMQNLIQHDASLNPGNSGGPLINSNGEVVGINTLKISSGEGIGFAIPSKSFKSLLNSFTTKINYEIPYLGLYGFDNEIANYYGRNDLKNGFYVMDISNTSTLKDIGVEKDSVILKINNKPIVNTLDLKDELYKCSSGERVVVDFYKNGRTYQGITVLR